MDLILVEKNIGIKFKDKALLMQALTHRSYLNEHPYEKLQHNERLEFLGDAVLELVVTECLFNNYPNPEGELTLWRSALVNSETLFVVAGKISLEPFILMSKGEKKDTGKGRHYIVANAVEAVIGAIYLDRGYKSASKFINAQFIPLLSGILENILYKDSKSFLQEKSQEILGLTPKYNVVKEWGPDHDKHFEVAVILGDEEYAKGKGSSKQEAEKNAALAALRIKKWYDK